jgi:uncharacterized protein (TIGR02246 family)
MPSVTPADVLAQRRRLTLSGDADGLADLFAPDAVIEAPFAPPGTPARLEGREAIREYSRHVMASPLRLEDYEVTELYQTQDPEVVIVEMRAKATLTTTGQSFAATSIQVLRVREGQIVLFRDFANPRILEDVIGEPRPEFARVVTAQAGAEGFDDLIRRVQQQLPGACQQPGFKGFYLLTDAETGKVITISLWDTREQMPSGIQDQAAPATWLTPPQLEIYEVTMQA